jgi:hypothetical protein
LPVALVAKLREGAYEGRRKAMAQQKADEQKVWSIMWTKMSPASQSKIQEMENFFMSEMNTKFDYVIFPVFTRFSLPLEHDEARKDIPTWIVTC